jgi:carboxylesterase type B
MAEGLSKAVLHSLFHHQVSTDQVLGFVSSNSVADFSLGYPVLNVSESNDSIFVYTNYRVNAFGLLPGKEIAADPMSDLNPGLLDQHAALRWTNKYISNFGGDPRNVSIFGQSAGGGSVVAQVIAQNGRTSPSLFSKALASSPFWPKTYKHNAPQAQALYDSLANLTGCSGPDSLQCLKTVDVQAIRNASLTISGSHTYDTSSYTWSPVIDGSFLTQSLSSAVAKGQVNIDYGFSMYNLHEGENFIPPGLQHVESSGSPPFNSSITSITAWLKGYLPGLSDHDRSRVLSLYPPQGSAEGLPNYNTTYVRAGIIFRDTVLACPAYWMASAAHKKSYLGEYTIGVAKHASDTIFVSWKLPARNIVTNCMCSGTKSTQSNRLTRLHTKDLPVHLLRFSRRATLMLKS